MLATNLSKSDLLRKLDLSFDLVTIIHVQDGIATRLYSSLAHKEVLGHEPISCNGNVMELTHLYSADTIARSIPALIRMFELGMPNGFLSEMTLLHADGREIRFEHRNTLDPCDPHKCIVFFRDISDRLERERLELKRAQELAEFKRAHEQLEFFRQFDLSFDLVAIIEVHEGISNRLYSSQSYSTVLGHDTSLLLGDAMHLKSLFPPEFLEHQLPLMITLLEDGLLQNGHIFEADLFHIEGHRIIFEHRLSIDCLNSSRVVIVSRDITDRRERHRLESAQMCMIATRESELTVARLAMEKKMDEEAIHTISHQLKNRFIALKGLAQSMQDYAPQGLQSHTRREPLADLIAQANGGIRICLSETTMRMIAHNQYTRTDAEFDLHAELEELCGTRIKLVIDPNIPQRIMSDLNLILHVVENFTSNAGKYGFEGGEVRLHVSALPSKRLLVSVHNSPGEKHAELRERFGADSSSLFKGGVGAHANVLSTRKGLSIAKKCATILGGDVNIRFEPTEVVAMLECSYTILAASLSLPTSTLIASVDDSALIRTMDRALMGRMNIDVESAQHVRGSTADEIRYFPEYVKEMDPQPMILLMDENLDHPVNHSEFMKGTELIPRLRELGFEGKIVIKSANASPLHAESYMACGADGVVAKGIKAFDMNRQLASILFGLCVLSEEAFDPRTMQEFALDERRDLADVFISDVNELLMTLQGAVQICDYALAYSTLHAMKGTCMNLGARQVGEMCHTLRGRTMEKEEWEAELVNLRTVVQQAFDYLERAVSTS